MSRLCRLPQWQRRRGTFWGSAVFHKLPPRPEITLVWKACAPFRCNQHQLLREEERAGARLSSSLLSTAMVKLLSVAWPSAPVVRQTQMKQSTVLCRNLPEKPPSLPVYQQPDFNECSYYALLTTSHTPGPIPNKPKGNGVIDLSGSRGSSFAALQSSNTPAH